MDIVLCRLHGLVNEGMYYKLEAAVKRCKKKEVHHLVIHINSRGGEMFWAAKMHTLLHSCIQDKIETIAIGFKYVHSAALMPYLSCIYRVAYSTTKFLIHRSKKIHGQNKTDHKIIEKEFIEYFTSITNISYQDYLKLANNHTYLTCEEAANVNIVNFRWEKSLL